MPEPEVGQSPKEVIWTKNKAKLYHYKPVKDILHPVPILMTYALINRPYILDLAPGNSLVEYLVNQGFDVYMIDWGVAGLEDKNLKYDDYIFDYLNPAVKKVFRTSGAKEITLLGYCMGGTITAMYAALKSELPIKNIVFLASPFDFSDAGLYSKWLDKKYFNIDKMVDVIGNIPADFIDVGNKMLKPVSNFYSSYKSLWERMWDQKFVEEWMYLNKWINDGVPFPGEAFRQWIKEFYQNNRLVRGELKLRGEKVDLSQISCPVLNVIGDRDHIVQPNQSKAIENYISSNDYEEFSVLTGHVSLVAGRQAAKVVWPKIGDWLANHQN